MKKALALMLAALMVLSIAPGVFATVKTDTGLNVDRDVTVSTIEEALNGPGMDLSYTNDAQTPWAPDSTTFLNRAVGATTTQGINNSQTTLSLTVELAADDIFTFDWFVSTEGTDAVTENESTISWGWYDYVTFRVNGEFVFAAKGNNRAHTLVPIETMENYMFEPAEAGTYTFEWTYKKDNTTGEGLDAFFLDNCWITQRGGPAVEISIVPSEVEITDTETAQLTATVLPATADDLTVTWTSSDNSVATVDENGLVSGVGSGTATITATSNSNPTLQATSTVTVISTAEVLQGFRNALNVEGGSLPFINSETHPWVIDDTTYEDRVVVKATNTNIDSSSSTVSLTVEAEAGNQLMFDWYAYTEGERWDYFAFYSNGAEIARIGGRNMDGFQRYTYDIPEDGTYTFTWTYWKDAGSGEGDAEAAVLDEVEFTGAQEALEGITVDPTEVELGIDETATITVAPVPESATLSEITWTTSDAAVATVEDGVITGVGAGTATITATSAEGFTATVEVEVEATIDIAGALNGSGMNFAYTNDTANPWIPNDTTFSNRNVGATTIQGKSNTSTTISTTIELDANEVFVFDWYISCEGADGFSDTNSGSGWYDYVTFTANDEFVFKARGNQNVYAAQTPLSAMETYMFVPEEAGTYTFEWTYTKDRNGNRGLDAFFLDNCRIVVSGPATDISVSPTEATLMESQSIQLTATVLPDTADDLTVTWSSSDNSVATVNNSGLVYAVGSGTAVITATSNSNPALQATATITVLSSAEGNQNLNEALNVEGGTLSFVNDAIYPWVVDNMSFAGRSTGKSNIEGIDGATSSVTLTIEAHQGETIEFDWFSTSESATFDYLAFYVNDERVGRIGGNNMTGLEHFSYRIPEDGMYTFAWTYRKDNSTSGGLDAGWVDEIEILGPPALEGIVVEPTSILLSPGGAKTVTVSPIPSDSAVSDITWTTSDATVATVEDGVITGVGLGTATITATSAEGFTAEVAVEVIEEDYVYGYAVSRGAAGQGMSEFALINNTATLLGTFNSTPYAMEYINGTLYGYAVEIDDYYGTITSVYFIEADADTLEYTRSRIDESNLMYDMAYDHSTGILYGLGECAGGAGRGIFSINPNTGTATLIAPLTGSNNNILTLACSTDGQLYGVAVTSGGLHSIDKVTGECTRIGATGIAPTNIQSMAWDHNNNRLLWAVYSSYKNGIYSVNTETGVATVIYPNTGEIVGLYVEYEGTPLPEQIPVTGITLEPTTLEVGINEPVQLTATVFPENASDKNVTWSSSNSSTIYVNSNGLVIARRAGTAVITAITVDGGHRATCTVTCTADEINEYVYVRTDEILPGEVYVIGAVDDAGDFYAMTDGFIHDDYNFQIAGNSAILGTYEGEEAVTRGITVSEEWIFEPTGDGVTIRNLNSFRYANPVYYSGFYWLGLTQTPDMYWNWDADNQYFVASNASTLGVYIHLAYGNFIEDPAAPNVFDLRASEDYFGLQLYVRQKIGTIPTEPPTTEPPTTEPPTTEPPTTEPSNPNLLYGTSFETTEEVDEWTTFDEDGDGHNWIWSGDDMSVYTAYEGNHVMSSASFDNDTEYPLTPDNWLMSPVVDIPANATDAYVSFWYVGQDEDWAEESFGVYLSTDGGNTWSDELAYRVASGVYQNLVLDLTEYAGESINIAIRHYDVTDMFMLNIDLFEIYATLGDEPPVTEPPEDTYTVTFYDWDGTVLDTQEVEEGSDATLPADPSREGYIFLGWEGNYTNVTSDESVYAVYRLIGDANGDDSLNTGDAAYILRYVVDLVDMTPEDLLVSDVNGDGVVNTGDAAALLELLITAR